MVGKELAVWANQDACTVWRDNKFNTRSKAESLTSLGLSEMACATNM